MNLAIEFAYADTLLLSLAGAYLLIYCNIFILGLYALLFPDCIFFILATKALNHCCGVSNLVNLSHATFLHQNPVSVIFQALKFLTAGESPYLLIISLYANGAVFNFVIVPSEFF